MRRGRRRLVSSQDTSGNMKTRHDRDRDIIAIELIYSTAMAQSSELSDGAVLDYSMDKRPVSIGEMGIGKGLLPQAPEPTSSAVAGET